MIEKTQDHEAATSPYDGDCKIDVKTDRALMRKVDSHIIPVIVVMYLFSFLDRGLLA